ncbi:MAG TPA: amidohydrolase family protein [Pyrinomonadaceae bacterium]
MLKRPAILLCCLALLSASAPARPRLQQTTAKKPILIKAGRLLDVKWGQVLAGQGVLVENGRIKRVGPLALVLRHAPKNVTVVDLGDAMLLPGLIDCHSHLFLSSDGRVDTTLKMSINEREALAAKMAREVLEAGITTVRNLGHSGVRGDADLRDEINAGRLAGPRILAATRKLTPPGGQLLPGNPATEEVIKREFLPVNGALQARQAVRQAIKAGADVIKIVVDVGQKLLSEDEVKAIVDEAHRARLKVAAHATTEKGAATAALAGVDSIEHGTRASDETFRLMQRKGIFLVPTDYTEASLRQIFAANLRQSPADTADFEAWLKEYLELTPRRFQRAMKAGVKIAAGSDQYFIYPGRTRGQATLLMLETLVSEGLPALEAIRAATVNASELLGWQDRIGTIEAGKYADIIAVEGDPLKEIKELQRVSFVMKDGVVIRNDERGSAATLEQ